MVKRIRVDRHIRNGSIVESHDRLIEEEESLTKEIKRKREQKRQANVLFPTEEK